MEKLYIEAKGLISSKSADPTDPWSHPRIKEIQQELLDMNLKIKDIRHLESAIFGLEHPDYWMHSFEKPEHAGRGLLAFDLNNLSSRQLKLLLEEKKGSVVAITIKDILDERLKSVNTLYRWIGWW